MKLSDLSRGVLLKLVLDRLARRPEGTRTRRRGPRRDPAARVPRAPRAPAPRGRLFGLMLASAAVAVPLMILFESPVTRVVGVLGLFTFIVSGVFVIADPAFLEGEEGS